MKKYQIPEAVVFLLVIVLVTFIKPAAAQKTYPKKSQAVYMQRQANYKTLLTDMQAVRKSQTQSMESTTTSFQLATLYAKNNIYPTKSSVALLYNLNPQLDATKPVPNGYAIRTLHFTPAPKELLEASLAEFNRLKVPNPGANEQFFGQSRTYERLLATLNRTTTLSPGLADTMQKFANVVLPNISHNAGRICEAQMQYFNLELGHILRLMGEIIQQRRSDSSVFYSITQMISDFMEITGSGQDVSTGDQDPGTRKKVNPKFLLPKSSISGKNVFKLPFIYDISYFFTPWANPPNVDIYVFRSTAAGEQDSLPAMNAFDVYYDSNGYIYSLTKGCDTLSFFTLHPLNPASTLPLTLGMGNYCFVLKDRKTGRIFLQPDVNLAVNKDYDENNRVIIPFYIEED